MQLTKIFAKEQPSSHDANDLIHAELKFLLERSEQRFTRQLRAHLLHEGCNLPIRIAKPRFYELMLAGLFAKASPLTQAKFVQKFPSLQVIASQSQCQGECIPHAEFFQAMLFFESHLDSSGKHIALEVAKSIDTIKEEWQLDESFFHGGVDHFEICLQSLLKPLFQGVQTSGRTVLRGGCVCSIPLELVRRRLYIALTTSLLHYVKERKPFQAEFGSIPDVVKAMQKDHQMFCRFMAFCRERIPYFPYIVSQTFWRTLETLRLEGRRQEVEKVSKVRKRG